MWVPSILSVALSASTLKKKRINQIRIKTRFIIKYWTSQAFNTQTKQAKAKPSRNHRETNWSRFSTQLEQKQTLHFRSVDGILVKVFQVLPNKQGLKENRKVVEQRAQAGLNTMRTGIIVSIDSMNKNKSRRKNEELWLTSSVSRRTQVRLQGLSNNFSEIL